MSVRIGSVSTLEEMDTKVLQFQHEKLKQRFESRKKYELELKDRIAQLEKRQTQDDAVLNVVNRHWNQLDEDMRILLQRMDCISDDEPERRLEGTTAFLIQLLTYDKEELDEKLANRVLLSKMTVGKILKAYDRLQQRNERILRLMKGESDEGDGDSTQIKKESFIKNAYIEIQEENNRVQALNTTLHENAHTQGLKMKQITDRLTVSETKSDELRNQVEELNWDICKLRIKNDELMQQNLELCEKYKRIKSACDLEDKKESEGNAAKKVDVMDSEYYVNLQKELEEAKEISNSRLEELEKLHSVHKETLKEVVTLRVAQNHIPEEILIETPEFKCLQSKFSVLFNNTNQIRLRLEELKTMILNVKEQHSKHVASMEREELVVQIKLKTEILHIEDTLLRIKKEYLKLGFQNGRLGVEVDHLRDMNLEMKHLMTSLQNHNRHLKRYRRMYRDLQNANKLRKIHPPNTEKSKLDGKSEFNGCRENGESPTSTGYVIESHDRLQIMHVPIKRKSAEFLDPNDVHLASKRRVSSDAATPNSFQSEFKKGESMADSRIKVEMKPNRKCSTELREWEHSERDQQQELAKIKCIERKLQDCKKDGSKRFSTDEEIIKIVKELEEEVRNLQRQVAAQKQEEDALILEMEVTGQAFEDLQEQNSRLIQQLQEKDKANLALIAENLKAAQLKNLVKEQNDAFAEQVKLLNVEVEYQIDVARSLDEKEKLLLAELHAYEKESAQRQSALELTKRKLTEGAQSNSDLKIHLDKYKSQVEDAYVTIQEKTSALEAEGYKLRRLQEEVTMYKRTVERLEKIDMAGNTDEVLQEEIREYKETLTCPSCKVNRKDAVLTKCFHVFCFDCLRTCYETRQRKCPKCNGAFGAKDYRRLYLT